MGREKLKEKYRLLFNLTVDFPFLHFSYEKDNVYNRWQTSRENCLGPWDPEYCILAR